MQIDVVTLFPEMFTALNYGISGRAIKQHKVNLSFFNPRDYVHDVHKTVDDRPYGGGPGMVMLYQPLFDAIQAAKQNTPNTPKKVIHLSPQGQPLDHQLIMELSQSPALILLCGRYEGIDQRLLDDTVDLEVSVGDFVVSGGELPAMLLIDSLIRQLPGTLGHANSAAEDSFFDGLLDCPHYTRPDVIHHKSVPTVLQSGDHQAIARWRRKQSLGKTWQKRPDLIKRRVLTELEHKLLEEYKKEADHD